MLKMTAGLVVAMLLASSAQEPRADDTARRLDLAKASYRQAMQDAKIPILKKFDEADSRARDKADSGLVETLKKEQKEFEMTGVLPTRFKSNEYDKAITKARASLRNAYTVAIGEYLRKRDDEIAKKTQAELEAFQRKTNAPVAPSSGTDITEAEYKKIKGIWKIANQNLEGRARPPSALESLRMTIDGEKYTILRGTVFFESGVRRLEPTKIPKEVDVVVAEGANKGKTFLGIYQWDGDSMRICQGLPGKRRPTDFNSGPGRLVSTYVRIKQ